MLKTRSFINVVVSSVQGVKTQRKGSTDNVKSRRVSLAPLADTKKYFTHELIDDDC